MSKKKLQCGLSPETKLYYVTGPFNGTGATTSSRFSAVYIVENKQKEGITKQLESHIIDEFLKKHKAHYVKLHYLTNNSVAKKNVEKAWLYDI